MLSEHWSDTEDPVHLTKPRLEPGFTLSRSTPQLNSIMATETELNAKESEILKEKVHLLKIRRELLQKKLEERLLALRELCLAEAEIIGVLPPEFPVIPGQPKPLVKKRIGTEFTLSSKFLERDACKTNDAIERLELEVEIQQQILTAGRKLADDKALSKAVRKKHRLDYYKQSEKLKSLEETLSIYRKERGTRLAYSKTTDDVEFNSPKTEDTSRNSEPSYSTLPNPHRRPTTPQPQSRKDYYSSNSPSSAKMSDSTLPSVDNSSISSSSSSMISMNQNRLNPQMHPTSYRPDSSSMLMPGYQQPSLGGYSQLMHPMSSSLSYQKRKGSSVSPSTAESSDLTSSCSSSLSSLQLNIAPDTTVHADLYQGQQQQQQQQIPMPHILIHQDSGLDLNDYSSYLRNTQKVYYAPNGKFSCGSLDRKKVVKKQSCKIPSPDINARLVELAELKPSKFGSKRESTVDSQDSPFQFEEDSVYSDKLQPYQMPYKQRTPRETKAYNAPPSFGQLKESSSESSGIVSGLSPTEELSSISEQHSVAPDKRWHRRLPEEHDASSFRSDSFQLPQNRNPDFYSRPVSEMSEMHEYSESLRSMQQKHLELNRVKMTPASQSVNSYEPLPRTRKNKLAPGQSSRTQARKSTSRRNSNDDAVDALFMHNNQQSHVNAYEYCRRNSGVGSNDLLPNKRQLSDYVKGNTSSSLSALTSVSVNTSAAKPLRFVKVITDDATARTSASGQHGRPLSSSSSTTTTSSTLTPSPFQIDGCSTLV